MQAIAGSTPWLKFPLTYQFQFSNINPSFLNIKHPIFVNQLEFGYIIYKILMSLKIAHNCQTPHDVKNMFHSMNNDMAV